MLLRVFLLAALGSVACTEFLGNLDRIIAIELIGSIAPKVEEGDTLQLEARARRADGQVVPDAEIRWAIIDVDSGQIGFTLDSATGVLVAVTPSSGRVQARVDDLASGAITVTVSGAPDSIALAGPDRVVFDTTTAASPALESLVLDLTTSPGDTLGLREKTVTYTLTDPPAGNPAADGVFLTVSDTVPGADPHAIGVQTDGSGKASVFLRRLAALTIPDSVVVEASIATAIGDFVPGSPIVFVVVIQ